MTTREHPPVGAPCWIDLSTSDVEGSRRFYSELFGWEAQEPSAEFGGYFMWTRNGMPIAGGMGPMPDFPADNRWHIYLATDDAEQAVKTAEADGATVTSPIMPIADLGIQAMVNDPTGAEIGLWQEGTFPGFITYGEPGTPSWFELHTTDHERALNFYRNVFRWDVNNVGDTDEFRYATMRDPNSDGELAGVMDAKLWPDFEGSHWSIYWYTDDIQTTVAQVTKLGGSVVDPPVDTPYGKLATVKDPAGARFKLHTPNA